MKNWQTGIIAILIILVGVVGYMHYSFKSSIAYINSSKLLHEYKGMVEARKDFQKKTEGWQAEIDTMYGRLQGKLQEYEQKKSLMTADEQANMEKLLASKKKEYEKHQKVLQSKAKTEDQQMTEEIIKEVNTFITEYGKKHGYTLVFGITEQGNLVYADDKYNITEEVILAINKHYRSEE